VNDGTSPTVAARSVSTLETSTALAAPNLSPNLRKHVDTDIRALEGQLDMSNASLTPDGIPTWK